MKFHQFPRSDGRMGRAVPCCSFLDLLKLLAMLPGTRASLLRQNMAEITTRAIAGDHDLEAMGGDVPVMLSSRNPVLQNMIAKLDLDFFQDCDPTPHGKFSYQKVTKKITGKSAKNAKSLMNRIFNGPRKAKTS